MLPFPVFLLLIFSATLLAPAPAVLIDFLRAVTLQSSEWDTLPISSSTLPLNSSKTPSFPVLLPQVSFDVSPTCRAPSPICIASNNTIPHLHAYTADDRTTSTAVLVVVALTMVNCLIFRLLADNPGGAQAHSAGGESEQLMLSPYSTSGAPPPQELGCYYMANGMASPLLAVDTTTSVSDSLGCGALPHVVAHPPFSPFVLALSSPTYSTFERSSSSLNTLSYGFSLEGSEKTRVDDSTPAALSISVCSSSDSSSAVTQSIDSEVLGITMVVSAAMADDLKPEPRQSVLPDTVVKDGASPLLDQSDIPQSQEPEHKNEGQRNSVLSPAVEDARELDTNAQEASGYQSHNLECDNDETFDYKGVDWEPEALGTPPTPATETRGTLSSSPLLETRYDFSFGHAPLSPEKDSASASPPEPVINTGKLSAVVSPSSPEFTPGPVALQRAATVDDSLIGIKYKGDDEITLITRCASANDLGGILEHVKATHAFTVPDGHIAVSPHDVVDNLTICKQVTLLNADAPVFKPRSSEMGEEGTSLAVTQQPVVVGSNASIHAPRNEECLQTQECVEVSESKHATRRACAPTTTFETSSDVLEPFVETGGFQPSTHAADGPESYKNTKPAESDSSGVSNGIYASIHALDQSDTGPYQALDETPEKLGLQPSHTVAGSSSAENGEQRGLTASIHAPGGCLSSQAAKHSSSHSADAPNWAAAARNDSEDSAKSGSSCPTRRDGAQEPALDEDESEPSTSTRCAVQDEEEGSVDNSDGSLGSTDDQEGGTGPGEIENGLDAGADSNEEGSTTRSRRSRRRGKPRRTRQKVPYLPPPRMRNLTQHPIVDIHAAQAQAHGAQAAPSTGSQYYSHAPPQMPQHGTSIQGHIIPPSVITHGQLGQHLHYNKAQYMPPPQPVGMSLLPVPNLPPFPPPDPYHPALYPHSSFSQYVSPQVPFASPYGR